MSDIAVAAVLAGHDPARLDGVDRDRPLGRADRARAGVVVGNAFSHRRPDWLAFIGTFAGVVLTFLAGAEVDVPQFRGSGGRRLSIGARLVRRARSWWRGARRTGCAGWNQRQAEIGGLALSTTSLAVVYAVLVETGLNRSRDRQADHVRDLRHRHRHGDRPVGPLHHADDLDRPVRRRLGRADRRAPADRPVVLRPLRRPRDRARDQARLRDALPAHVARRPRRTRRRCCRRSCSDSR